MAILSYTTTAAEDAGILHVLTQVNAQRAAQTPPLPALTAAQYVQQILAGVFASYIQQRGDVKTSDVGAAYRSADAATQQKIRTDLGLGTPP